MTTILTDRSYISDILQERRPDAHKGDFGRILIFAGSAGMAGAAILCGRAALRSGAGLVQFLLPDFSGPLLPILQISVPEATCILPTDDLSAFTAAACGCGLGKSETAERLLSQILDSFSGTLVLDADALNLIAASAALADKVRGSAADIILTPHIGEARRLLHSNDPIAGEESRTRAVRELAQTYRCIAVLKGAGTLITTPPEDTSSSFPVFRNPTGNPGMATAGSGDSLAGLIASLAGQGYTPLDAARIGVYIHGLAGDLAAHRLGEMGMTASDIVHSIPDALMRCRHLPSEKTGP